MKVKDCYLVGYILRPHAISGMLSIYLDVDFPSEYASMDSIFVLENGNLVPYFIKEIKVNNNKAIVKFEDITSIEMAEALAGKELYLPLNLLPKLSDTQFYYHEVEGFQVEDKTLGKLGLVATVYSMPNQDLLAMIYKDAEILIPVNDALIKKVDRIGKILHVDLPEGLLDVYLEG